MKHLKENPLFPLLSPFLHQVEKIVSQVKTEQKQQIQFATPEKVYELTGISKIVQARLRSNMKVRFYRNGQKVILYKLSEFYEDLESCSEFSDKL